LLTAALARVLQLQFNRVVCTPDLTPEDVAGSEIPGDGRHWGERRIHRGPVFSQLLLAHELNRTPPKTQMAVLEPMRELCVTVGSKPYEVEPPFFVVATHNPTEHARVFPLSDELIDQFMMSIEFTAPSIDEERQIVALAPINVDQLQPVLTPQDILWIQHITRLVPATRQAIDYAADLVRATRPGAASCPEVVRRSIEQGAGPRTAQCLIMAARARAVLKGRCAVHAADIRAELGTVLRHRLHWTPNAKNDGVGLEQVVRWLIEYVPEPSYGEPVGLPPELIVVDRGDDLPPAVDDVTAEPLFSDAALPDRHSQRETEDAFPPLPQSAIPEKGYAAPFAAAGNESDATYAWPPPRFDRS
jgi:MoxR-like ATPase